MRPFRSSVAALGVAALSLGTVAANAVADRRAPAPVATASSATGATTEAVGSAHTDAARVAPPPEHAQAKGRDKAKKSKGMRDDGPATDYVALASTLSQPDYPQIVRESYDVDSPGADDPAAIYVEVVRPDPAAYGDGPWPVVMEISPYHGTIADRKGIRIFPDPVDADGQRTGLTDYFAPRGYAVAIVDLRGTGKSDGCLDHLGPNDAIDMKTVIEWAADQPWSTGRVGLTGHSYVGSTPSVAAAQAPRGLVTIAPSAGLASMYDHQFNYGVPWSLQWVGPQVAYPTLATQRDMPPGSPAPPVIGGGDTGDDFGSNPQDTACGWQNSALTAGQGQVTGQYQAWHAERDWREGATGADIPVFMIHGVNDNAARIPAAEWFFGNRFDRPGDKVWLGQWDHGSSNGATSCEAADPAVGHVNCRFEQWQYALHAWFDKHLQQREVDTGNPVEVFLNDDTVFTSKGWSAPADTVTFRPDAIDDGFAPDGTDGEGTASFQAASGGLVSTTASRVEFVSNRVKADRLFVGLPQMQLDASVTGSQVIHLVATLSRQFQADDGSTQREAMTYCAIQPSLREGVDTFTPIVPGERMTLDPQCFTMAHRVHAGDQLVLTVGVSSPHHVELAADPQVTVYTGPEATAITLPVIRDASAVHPDPLLADDGSGDDPLPTGPAHAPVSENVAIPAPSLDAGPIAGVSAALVEFETTSDQDNASLAATATPALPADLDLYLEQLQEDGSWEQIDSGLTTLDHHFGEGDYVEKLDYGRLEAGTYRLVVHNYFGPPNDVAVEIRFFDANGVEGTG